MTSRSSLSLQGRMLVLLWYRGVDGRAFFSRVRSFRRYRAKILAVTGLDIAVPYRGGGVSDAAVLAGLEAVS